MNRKAIFLFFIAFQFLFSATLENLYEKLSTDLSDKDKVNTYLQMGMEYEYSNLDSALHYYHLGQSIAEEMSLSKDKDTSENGFLLLSACYTNFGIVHNILGDYQKSIEYYHLALEVCQKLENIEAIGTLYNNIGIIYAKQSLYNKALEYCQKGLDIAREVDNLQGIVNSLNNLGLVYSEIGANQEAIPFYYQALDVLEQGNVDETKPLKAMCYLSLGNLFGNEDENEKAIQNFTQASQLFREIGDELSIALCNNNIGLILKSENRYNEALEYLEKSLAVKIDKGYKDGIASSYHSIGDVYISLQDYGQAEKHLLQAVQIYKEIGNLEGEASVYGNLSKLSLLQNEFNQALTYAKQTNRIAERINRLSSKQTAHLRMSEAYEKLHNFKASLAHYKTYKAISDSLYNNEKSKQLIEIETKYETEKKEQENKFLQKKNIFNELVISRQKSLRNFLIIILLVVAISMILIYNQYRLKKIAFQELKQADKLIQKQRDELELMNQTRNQFFSIVSHDLKNSFTSLQMGAKMLSDVDSLDKNEVIEISKEISDSVENLYRLLENLLEWARFQIGKTHHQPEKINLSNIISEILTLLEHKAKQKKIDMIVNQGDFSAFADPNMMYSVLHNVIVNAIKFTPPNGKIEIRLEEKEKGTEIEISDNGIGMNRKQLEQLFKVENMFTRPGTAAEKGTGLGLILCKEFIEKNKGSISIESEENKGTSVQIILPKNESENET